MGNYLFNPGVLVELLEDAQRAGATDFGRHIMPLLPWRKSAWAYDFADNKIPGVHSYEEHGYWRDIGTIEAYRAAQRDVLGPSPRFDLANPEWPIRANGYCLPESARCTTQGPAHNRRGDRLRTHAGFAYAASALTTWAGLRAVRAEEREA
jgi:ADP-glucose pyrophosphorylase